MKLRRFASFAAIILTGCVTEYSNAPHSAAAATVLFKKAYTTGTTFAPKPGMPFGNVAYQEYGVGESKECRKYARTAFFKWTTGAEHARIFSAGRVVHIFGVTLYDNTVGFEYHAAIIEQRRCAGYATFTPIAGHTYDVGLDERENRACRMSVTDAATGKSPEDLTVVDNFECKSQGY